MIEGAGDGVARTRPSARRRAARGEFSRTARAGGTREGQELKSGRRRVLRAHHLEKVEEQGRNDAAVNSLAAFSSGRIRRRLNSVALYGAFCFYLIIIVYLLIN